MDHIKDTPTDTPCSWGNVDNILCRLKRSISEYVLFFAELAGKIFGINCGGKKVTRRAHSIDAIFKLEEFFTGGVQVNRKVLLRPSIELRALMTGRRQSIR